MSNTASKPDGTPAPEKRKYTPVKFDGMRRRRVDAYAKEKGRTFANAVRYLVDQGLKTEGAK